MQQRKKESDGHTCPFSTLKGDLSHYRRLPFGVTYSMSAHKNKTSGAVGELCIVCTAQFPQRTATDALFHRQLEVILTVRQLVSVGYFTHLTCNKSVQRF